MYNSENPSVKIKQRNKASTVYKYKTSKYNKSKYISDHSKHKWNKLDKQQKYLYIIFEDLEIEGQKAWKRYARHINHKKEESKDIYANIRKMHL